MPVDGAATARSGPGSRAAWWRCCAGSAGSAPAAGRAAAVGPQVEQHREDHEEPAPARDTDHRPVGEYVHQGRQRRVIQTADSAREIANPTTTSGPVSTPSTL